MATNRIYREWTPDHAKGYQDPRVNAQAYRLPWQRAKTLTWVALMVPLLSGAQVDVALLPLPADKQVEFETDILPIFEQSCFRCHGAFNPKSEFSLTTREKALTSGAYGGNIIPGDGTNSPLVHFVARLVEDSEMPPEGKGEPLTAGQVSLLRAWIDQGASWGKVRPPPKQQFELMPTFGYYFVDGDAAKFREHHWVNDGTQGEIETFHLLDQINDNTKFDLEGHVLRDDYEVTLSLERRDVGFVRAGFEQFRRYYDNSGGYMELFPPTSLLLDEELSMDIGQAWFEVGWNQPGLPKVVLGYEYHYKEGEKSSTQWLLNMSPTTLEVRNLNPSSKKVDEEQHVLRLDVSHQVAGVDWEDNFRYEFYDLETERDGQPFLIRPFDPPPVDLFTPIDEGQEYQRLVNTLFGQKQVYDWLLLSGGYLYTRLFDGEASFRQNTIDASGNPASGYYWSGNEITLDHHAHVGNLNAQLGPWQGLTLAAGVMPEWSRQRGFGVVNLDEGLPPFTDTDTRLPVIESDYDQFKVEEHAELQFRKIPFTVLFAKAQLQQESISQFESKAGESGNNDAVADFVRDTDATGLRQDYRGGFHVSPWSRVSLSAHYRYEVNNNDYDHRVDQSQFSGYSAFIRELESQTDEVEAKLTLKPSSWLKTTLTYRVEKTDYETSTDAALPFAPGGALRNAGEYDAQSAGVNLVITPWRRLYLSTTFLVSESRIRAYDNGSAAIVPYEGETYSVLPSATWMLNDKTDLSATYSFSYGDYEQNNQAAGLPLGIKYTQHSLLVGLRRQLTDRIASKLQYGYFQYDEPSAGGGNDYEAHGIFASVVVRFP